MQSQDVLISILQKQERSKSEIEYLMRVLAQLKFFEEQQQNLTTYLYFQLFRHLEYDFRPKESTVFNYGDYGQSFYIILRGSVQVLLPKPHIQDEISLANISVEEINHKVEHRRKSKYSDMSEYISHVYSDFQQVRTLGPGEAFGEIALITKQKRTATIVCTEDTHLITLQKMGFDRVLGELLNSQLRKKLQFFESLQYFQNIPENHLTAIINQTIEIQPKLNDILYRERDEPTTLYLVWRGEVELSKFIPPRQRIVISLLTQGSVFGEEEILNNCQRKYRASCKSSNTILMTLSAQQYMHLLKTYNMIDDMKIIAEIQLERRLKDVQLRKNATENLLSISPKRVKVDNLDSPEITRFQSFRSQRQVESKYIPITNSNCLIPIDIPKYVKSSHRKINTQISYVTRNPYQKLKSLLQSERESVIPSTEKTQQQSSDSRFLKSLQYPCKSEQIIKPTKVNKTCNNIHVNLKKQRLLKQLAM
ncbi:hypothetical protein pb186bvf_015728 [Paramecium bursaria]